MRLPDVRRPEQAAVPGLPRAAEGDRLLRKLLSPRLFELGLICRADDRGDPVLQLSPALVAGTEEFDLIADVIRTALTESMGALSA